MVCALWLAYFSQQIWTNELARTHAHLNFVHIENPFGEVMSCYAVVVFVTVGWLPLFLLVKTQQSVSQPRNKRKYVHILCTNSHWQLITSNGIQTHDTGEKEWEKKQKYRNHAFNLKREFQLFNDFECVSVCEGRLKNLNSVIFSLSLSFKNRKFNSSASTQ